VWPDTVFAYNIAKKGITKRLLVNFVRFIYTNCNNITVSSPGFIPVLNKYCPAKEIQFIPQWSLTPKLIKEERSIKDIKYKGRVNFVFAGNISKTQNLDNVITGFAKFIATTAEKDIWLNIIGDGSYLNYLKKKVDINQITNVEFFGRIKLTDMPHYYEKANILVISLENEPIFNLTIPAKFQSYLNAEKPILGILNGEVANLIKINNLGWIASPDNIMEIANSFKEIANSSQEVLNKKTKNTNVLLEDQFCREKIIQKFTTLVFG
jgi:glycosyltransferase involved in cell wall biosynthesis